VKLPQSEWVGWQREKDIRLSTRVHVSRGWNGEPGIILPVDSSFVPDESRFRSHGRGQ
jgi:hypothetical protein